MPPFRLLFTFSDFALFHSAGNAATFSETCSGFCYEDWVLGSPSNYDSAYFEVNFVRVFNNGTDRTIIGINAAPGMRPPTRGRIPTILTGLLAIALLQVL